MRKKIVITPSADWFNNIKAVLFDMDGTIIDTEPLHAQALQATLRQYGIEQNLAELDDRYHGQCDVDVYENLKEEINSTCETFIMIKEQILINIIKQFDQMTFARLLTPGLHQLLLTLNERQIKTGLVSASERSIIDLILKKTGLTNSFDLTLSRIDSTEYKPSPVPYLNAMRKLNVTAAETLIFEDSPTGLRAAQDSGAFVVAILTNKPLTSQIRNSIPTFADIILT